MDGKTLAGKTLFFIMLCAFVAAFSSIFGSENTLVGVIIIVIALMMLQKDLSLRPVWNLASLLLFTLTMGLGAFVALYNPFLGIVINFGFVFIAAFTTMHDLNTPMHFPFLLGYAFLLSVPVSAEELPMRMFSLAIGSVFVVGMNVLFHHGKMRKTSHNGIVSICGEVRKCCQSVIDGDIVDSSELERLCSDMNRRLYDRMKDRFLTTPNDRTILDLVTSLQNIGMAVCERERDSDVLRNLIALMDEISVHESGETDLDSVHESIRLFLQENDGADFAIRSALRCVDDELCRLEKRTDGNRHSGYRVSGRTDIGAVLKEVLRMDSVKTTFAFRMAILFSFWAFVWQYWEVENAKWLLFTTIALVQPYVDGTWSKSVMRVTGTLIGTALFMVILVISGGESAMMACVLLGLNYVYTVFDPKRYDVMMVFITASALVTASMITPADDAVIERLLFILLGVAAAIVANYTILPYRIRDENMGLGRRHLGIAHGLINMVGDAARGTADPEKEAYFVLTAGKISMNMESNLDGDPDESMRRFVDGQSTLVAECSLLIDAVEDASDLCKERVAKIVDGMGDDHDVREEDLFEGLDRDDSEFVRRTTSVISRYNSDRKRLGDIVLSGYI